METQQRHLELLLGQACGRQRLESFLQRAAGDRERIDRIGLAALTHTPSRGSHQMRRQPDHDLAVIKQEPLKRPGHMPAVLDHPPALGIQPPAQPNSSPNPSRTAAPPVTDLATEPVNSYRRVRVLVRINPNCHHVPVPFLTSLVEGGLLADRS